MIYMSTTLISTKTPVIVIPCGGQKASEACAARDLYTGSAFQEQLAGAIAEVGENNVYILSALHGLIGINDVIAPYDVKMGDKGSISKTEKGFQRLVLGIIWYGLEDDDLDVYAMLPNAYFSIFDKAMRYCEAVPPAQTYEATAGIGEHKAIAKKMRLR
jgi:hypothetical protein